MFKMIIVLIFGCGIMQNAISGAVQGARQLENMMPAPLGPYRQSAAPLSADRDIFKTFRYPPDAYLPSYRGNRTHQEGSGYPDPYQQGPDSYGREYRPYPYR